MSNTQALVEAIRRQEKHTGHSGGLDGCPLCDRAAEKKLIEELGAEPEATGPADPADSRLAKILGDM